VPEIRDQLQDLGEIMYDKEMITIVLNALPEERETSHPSSMGRRKLLHSMIYGHYEKLKKLGLRQNLM